MIEVVSPGSSDLWEAEWTFRERNRAKGGWAVEYHRVTAIPPMVALTARMQHERNYSDKRLRGLGLELHAHTHHLAEATELGLGHIYGTAQQGHNRVKHTYSDSVAGKPWT